MQQLDGGGASVYRQVTCLTHEAEDGTLRVQPTELVEQVLELRRRAG